MYDIEIIDSHERLMALEPSWNGFLEGSDLDNPFMTFEWFSSWWESFGRQNSLLILLVKKGGEVVAVAPLMRTRAAWRRFPVTAVTFIGNHLSERNGIILKERDPAIVFSLFRYLRAHVRCDLLMLDHMVKGSQVDRSLETFLRETDARYLTMPGNAAPYIEVDGTWEEYLKTLPKNFRSRMNNIGNNLARAGNGEIVRYAGADVDEAMRAVLAVSRRSWKYGNGTAIASDPATTAFYTRLARRAAARGWLEIWVLKLDGNPIAFTFNIHRNGTVFGMKSGYDETYRRMAPSRFLNHHTIRDCFVRGAKEYDLLGKNDPFKMKWASRWREHRRYVIYSATFYGALLYSLETTLIGRLKKIWTPRRPVPLQDG